MVRLHSYQQVPSLIHITTDILGNMAVNVEAMFQSESYGSRICLVATSTGEPIGYATSPHAGCYSFCQWASTDVSRTYKYQPIDTSEIYIFIPFKISHFCHHGIFPLIFQSIFGPIMVFYCLDYDVQHA